MTAAGRYVFKPGRIPALAVILILPLLLTLGVWQLNRADEKRGLIRLQNARELDQPFRLDGRYQNGDDLRYRNVTISGRYDAEHQFLIDNQVFNGKVGFYVLTPLHIEHSDYAVLINRGWVPMGHDRTQLPDIPVRVATVNVTGIVDRFPSVGYHLDGAEIPTEGWPAIVQIVDAKVLSDRLGYPLMPYQVLLHDTIGEGYVREWYAAAPRMTPEKHLGYALQWFALATVLVLFFVWSSFKIDE